MVNKHFFKMLFLFLLVLALGMAGIIWIGNMEQDPSVNAATPVSPE